MTLVILFFQLVFDDYDDGFFPKSFSIVRFFRLPTHTICHSDLDFFFSLFEQIFQGLNSIK